MSLASVLIFLVVFAVAAYLAYYIITSFFPEPARTPALAVVGLVLLLVLIWQFFPGMGDIRIGR